MNVQGNLIIDVWTKHNLLLYFTTSNNTENEKCQDQKHDWLWNNNPTNELQASKITKSIDSTM